MSRLFGPRATEVVRAGDDSSRDDDSTRDDSWYVPAGEGDAERFLGPDGLPTLHLVAYRDVHGGEGFRLCEDSTGLLVGPTDRRLPYAGLLVVNVRGEVYNKQGASRGAYLPGEPITLIPEPTNPHDDRAVMVCDGSGGNKCGYMNKQQARRYLKLAASGEDLQGIVLFHRVSGGVREAVQILVTSPKILEHVRGLRPPNAPPPAHMR